MTEQGVRFRTWPYQTTKRVKVVEVEHLESIMVLLLENLDDPREADVCVYRLGFVEASVGDVGTLTFTEGGPTGGYWLFARDPKTETNQ